MSTIRDIFGVPLHYSQCEQTELFIAGIECEVEGVPNGKAKSVGIFSCKEDGSLRNNGWEFISTPANRETLVEEFIKLHEWLGLKDANDPFSHRTSIHVHVNCVLMEELHVRNMTLLYALFEEFFFSMVKPERRANIHCVPLTETYLPSLYRKSLPFYRERWHKYTALNLCPINHLGTLEFRHHHGTKDPVVLDQWLSVLENLWKLSQTVNIDERSLTDKATITDWFRFIFAGSPKTLMLQPSLLDIVKNSLIDVKLSTI